MNLNVGIVSATSLHFVLKGTYRLNGITYPEGEHEAHYQNGLIVVDGISLTSPVLFEPRRKTDCCFELQDVVIGVGFHWERAETQRFEGLLKLVADCDRKGAITAINILGLERYLVSVISSEMRATSNMELLKAHAVVSRSWLVAQLELKKRHFKRKPTREINRKGLHVKWYDRDDHRHYDVCADDHCQRYQGITRATTEAVEKAVKATIGEVIVHEKTDEICDARFSKCCGGITEHFENCWGGDTDHDYLLSLDDDALGMVHEEANLKLTRGRAAEWGRKGLWALRKDRAMESFIYEGRESDFCNTKDATVLREVLNGYDQETTDFYRWKVRYTQKELADLLRRRSGIDFGEIKSLTAVERGPSGRIVKLRIEGTKEVLTVGKELEIRKWLSESHLYSSAFVVETEGDQDVPSAFILHGAGWGHGVGMCQIGAAVMAVKGYGYKEIIAHYFKNTKLEKRIL